MKICVVFGTRPEAIKLAPVILALRAEPDITCRVCVTGQHRTMLDQVLKIFEIQPDNDLSLMRPAQTLAGLTAASIKALDQYFAQEKPDLVLVQGDTTTVLCAALSAFYRKIPVGHVEAGLRTWNLDAPWPEEANRVLTTRLASVHFAPTEQSRANLLKEGVPDSAIHVTGNTVVDALSIALKKLETCEIDIPGLPGDSLDSFGDAPVVLITGHRRESFGQGFENICRAIAELARRFPSVHFVYPVHLNPNVWKPVYRLLSHDPRHCLSGLNGSRTLPNIHLLEPLEYLPFVALMNRSNLILTDSGGVQEEAPSLRKTVLVMRDTTERPEVVQAGAVRLVGTSKDRIVDASSAFLLRDVHGDEPPLADNPYGNGGAAMLIVYECKRFRKDLSVQGNNPERPL